MSEISVRIIDKRSPYRPKEAIEWGSEISKVVADQRKICSAYWDLIGAFRLTRWEGKEQGTGKSIGTIMNGYSTPPDILRHITHTSSHKEAANFRCRPRQRSQLDTKPEKCLRPSHVTKYTDSGDTPKSRRLFSCGKKQIADNPTRPTTRHSRRSVNLPFLIYWLGFALLVLLGSVQGSRLTSKGHRKGGLTHSPRIDDDDMPMFVSAGFDSGLYPSMVNLAAMSRITANATCGENGPEHFCKLVEHVHRQFRWRKRRSQCDICDASTANAKHNIELAVDGSGHRWWQSPSINNGYEYHWVTITVDMKQVFQVAYVVMKAANSPRPGNWILEKSLDGVTWEPWQYFAMTNRECRSLYPGYRVSRSGTPRLRLDSEVVCTSYFSELLPLQNGEIHVSLVNGRPSAENPSAELIRFTSARYIRLRFQRIHTLLADLMTIAKNPADLADPTVTKRYFYSIKDITIGGMCICHGHAHDCPSNPLDGKFVCKCQHNTMGDNCEQCLPMFNQHPWRPGNVGFQCEECNCHGHASSCYYDENVERRKASLNRRGMKIGGGVCVGCRDFTAGINCESCVDGYFRPAEVHPTDLFPCRRCVCNPIGAQTTDNAIYLCKKSLEDVGESTQVHPGDCICKSGYTGARCDRCEPGFTGFPNCKPCPCSVAGSINHDACEGECICKENVVGVNCDQCKIGFYDLTMSSNKGCSQCYCFGMTVNCGSADIFRDTVTTLEGWKVSDRYGAYKMEPTSDKTLSEPFVSHTNATHMLKTGIYYWSAPEEYLGNRLTSYGGELKYRIYYELPLIDSLSVTYNDVDVILEGDEEVLELSLGKRISPFVSSSFVVLLKEDAGWVESITQSPATKQKVMNVLSNLHRLLIRASYNRGDSFISRIRDVEMQTATPDGGGETVTSVEMCRCPLGYSGLSCEGCDSGYYRLGDRCIECRCNGKSTTCDLETGVCENCRNSSTGRNCELCLPGYYKDADGNCQRCACPLTISSNNFSPTCVYDELDNTAVCQNCPEGYSGSRCERCARGYYGDSTVPGETCKNCECNGNSRYCDARTGRCMGCQGNTAGYNCQHCAMGYYGDAIYAKNCQRCACDRDGARYRNCNPVTGQCSCRSNIRGINCDECPVDHFLERNLKTCVSCDCDPTGSTRSECDLSGNCSCKIGVTGAKCDRCRPGYYNFGRFGCAKCNCPRTNGNCDASTGRCVCPSLTTGYRCTVCVRDSYGWDPELGCKDCGCNEDGAKASQCGLVTGSCQCKDEYEGEKCDRCRDGFYNFPHCVPCSCHAAGTLLSTCHGDKCTCSNDDQCQCRENVIGEHCDVCTEKSFSLQKENPKGCTECFCFGITNQCSQARFHWGDKIVLSDPMEIVVAFTSTSRVALANRFNTRSMTSGVLMSKSTASVDASQVKRSLGHTLYYWRLPPQFNGNKLMSYGGKLTFTVYFYAKHSASSFSESPTLIIRGKNTETAIGYYLPEPENGQSTSFTVYMREIGWTYQDSNLPVTRADFTMILYDIDYFMIKASFGTMTVQSRLSDVYLDVAVEGLGAGRGDASSASNGPVAYGIEQCACPPGYTGLSCQGCATGFMRVRTGKYLGQCRPCACNGKSDTCDAESGKCLNCRDHFVGDQCYQCKPGYYLKYGAQGPLCQICACPLATPENSFSTTCHSVVRGGDYVCDNCIRGYEGKHCERCSSGYFGDPTLPGGRCKKCGCNPSGSHDQICDRVTGQCNCVPGVTGQICDQCRPRHAITEIGCIKCSDGCTGKLIDEVESMTQTAREVKVDNMVPLPWGKLYRIGNETVDVEAATDRTLTGIVDDITSVDFASAQIRTTAFTIKDKLSKSLSCIMDVNVTAHNRNNTQESLLQQKQEVEKVLNASEALWMKLQRLAVRVKHGMELDGDQLTSKIIDLVSEWRNKSMSPYSTVANNELRLSEMLFNDVKRQFVDLVAVAEENYSKSKPFVSNATRIFQDNLQELNAAIMSVRKRVKKVGRLGRLNRGIIRQLSAEIESLGNNISIVISEKNASQRIVDEGFDAIQRAWRIIPEIRNGSVMLSIAKDQLKRKSDDMVATRVKLIEVEMLAKRAQNESRRIADKSMYFQKKAEEMRTLTLNLTEAAAKYGKAKENIRSAKTAADSALEMLSDSSLPELNGTEYANLVAQEKRRRKRANEKRRQVKIMYNQAKSKNETIEGLGEILRLNISRRFHDLGEHVPKSDIDWINAAAKKANSVTRKILHRVGDLQENVTALQNDANLALKSGEIVDEIRGNLQSVPQNLSAADAKTQEVKNTQRTVKAKSDQVRQKIVELRRQIMESRFKAGSIRDVSVKSRGNCVMRYAPRVKPSRVTEVVLQVMPESQNNTLFYLGRTEGDYILVYMQRGLVHVSWNLGSGRGNVVNPVYIVKNSTDDEGWFRIEIMRNDQEVSASVFKTSNKSGTLQTVAGKSAGQSVVLNVNETDVLYVGGVPGNFKLPEDVPSRSFTGSFADSLLQRNSIGLWNFREINSKTYCKRGPTVRSTRDGDRGYGYNGKSYSLIRFFSRWQTVSRITVIDMKLRTVSPNGMLLYLGSTLTNDFLSLELVDGHIVARIDLGSGVYVIRTEKKYNNGEWIDLRFRRLGAFARVFAGYAQTKETEIVKEQILNSDGHLNMSSGDLLCVGGCPSERILAPGVQNTGFIGCLRDFKLWNIAQALDKSYNVLRTSQVEDICPDTVSRDIGIADGGFVELPGHSLPVAASVSMTFNSREPDALLLLATDEAPKKRRRRRHSNVNFYSLSLNGGHIEARLRAVSGVPLVLKSTLNIYSDGLEHTVLLRREGNLIQLIVDDNVEGKVSGNLVKGGELRLETNRIYVGGIPESVHVNDMAGSGASLQGCVRELVTNGIVDFQNVSDVSKSYVGSCAYTPTLPFFRPLTRQPDAEAPTPTKESLPPPIRVSQSSLVGPHPSVVTIETSVPATETAGCAAESDFTISRDSNRRFGLTVNSHLQYHIDGVIATRFRIQIEFRTFASHGILLYAASDSVQDFFSLQLINGVPVFEFDCGKGPGKTRGNTTVNDGQWHTIRLSKSKRKGFLKVDNIKYDAAKSPKGATKVNVDKTLYVGGLPPEKASRLNGWWQSMDSCIRSVSINKAKLDMRKPRTSRDVGLCYQNVEGGAYFNGRGFAVYENVYRVGPTMTIELEFRTWSRDGALLSVSDSSRVDGLALELVNGSIIFRVDNGAGNVVVDFTPHMNSGLLCDGKWHRVKAKKDNLLLALNVDGFIKSNSQRNHIDHKNADTSEPLYIGGYPDTAHPQKQLTTKTKFHGCIRGMKLKGQKVDFSQVFHYEGVHPNSCPRSRGS